MLKIRKIQDKQHAAEKHQNAPKWCLQQAFCSLFDQNMGAAFGRFQKKAAAFGRRLLLAPCLLQKWKELGVRPILFVYFEL